MNTHSGMAKMPQDVTGLIGARKPDTVYIPPGGSYELKVQTVAKVIGGKAFPMLGYNASIPGPMLRVRQNSAVSVTVWNDTGAETTVHWHGLRLENQYDGVPNQTQDPIPPGGRYTHRLTFPDVGTFWYHPHIREDYAQELGLYGNVIVEPEDARYWPGADRDVVLTLDDILIEDDKIAPFHEHGANFAAMGRFGNVLLIGGETHQVVEARGGEVVRFHFTNTANTRVFKIVIPRHRMKLVGGDAGRYEREQWVDGVVVAPSERAIVDVLFDAAGEFVLQHVTPKRAYSLADITVTDASVDFARTAEFERLRVNEDMVAERERVAPYLESPPDKTLALVAEMDFADPGGTATTLYACPMHPDVVGGEPGKCPKCGMKLMPQAHAAATYTCPMHPDVVRDEPGKCPECGMKLMPAAALNTAPLRGHQHGHGAASHQHGEPDMLAGGIEWEDLMVEVNRESTAATMRWKVVDRGTGQENAEIDWRFTAGDQVKIRIVNEMESDHPMNHPFHIHGERFLVLARDGMAEDNLVWKDTVLIPTGQTVDLLLDASNPGRWMAHCHIAEHMEVGMMFDFVVADSSSAAP